MREAVGEPRFWLARAVPAFCSLAIGYAPEALPKLIANLGPWLNRPEEQLSELEQEMSQDLTRYFWIGGLIAAALVFWFGLIDPADLKISMDRNTYRNLQLFDLALYGYFCGSAFPVVSWGIWLLIGRLRSLDVKPGFILNGGKQALEPLISSWSLCGRPVSFPAA